MPFIWAILSNEKVLKAAQAVFSGSAGQQRVSASFIEDFPAIVPGYEKQIEMVSNLERALLKKNENIKLANKLLGDYEQQVAGKCNLKQENQKGICFAIKYSQLDGVIDAKRYLANKSDTVSLRVSDVCDVLDGKVNVAKYGKKVIDWIRIDDLESQPLDISEVRTQSASEIKGSFFEVEENDILVARLGPTILNQKIVMVRSLKRTTIASSEFLVIRCKGGIILRQ